jgi:hypothetical protein
VVWWFDSHPRHLFRLRLYVAGQGQFTTAVPVTVNGTYTPFSGDFNGDGFDDVFWYGPGGGRDSLWYGQAGLGSFVRP